MIRSENATAAILMMASMAAFVLNDTLMKMMAGQVPLFQLLFLRGILTSIAVGVMAWSMGSLQFRIPKRDRILVFWRMIAEIGMAYFFLTALFNMPMANVMAMAVTIDLFMVLTPRTAGCRSLHASC